MIITTVKKKKKKDEDIAPVFSNETKQKVKETVLQKIGSATNSDKIKNTWGNGYQVGDVTRTILDIKDAFSNLNPVKNISNKMTDATVDVINNANGGFFKESKAKENIKNIWDDGYQFGDIKKTKQNINKAVLGTTGDVATNWAKGELQTAEGLVDTGRYVTSDLLNLAGDRLPGGKVAANIVRQNAIQNTTGVILGENDIYNNPIENGWSKKLDEYSVAGNKLDAVVQSIGQQTFRVGLQEAIGLQNGGAAQTTLNNLGIFAGSYGQAKSEALSNGADDKTASLRGFISGTAETISENLFDTIPEFNTGGAKGFTNLKNLIGESTEKAFGKTAGKFVIRAFNGLGEGIEEGLSNGLETALTDITNSLYSGYSYGMSEGQGLNKENSFGENAIKLFKDTIGSGFSEEFGEAFISAFFSTLIFGAAVDNLNTTQKNQAIKSYAKDNNMSATETAKYFNEISKLRLNQVTDENTSYQDKVELEEKITKELTQELKGENKLDLEELYNQTPKTRKESQFVFTEDEAKGVKSDKQKVLANDLSRINNEKSVHKLYKVINAIQSANDTQQYHITTTEGLYEMGIVNKDENGNYTMPDGSPYVPRGLNYKNGEIYINADVGSQSGTQAVYHEMFEGFKKASPEQYNEFKQMVTDIIGEENIQKEFDTYKSMYGEELTDDIRDEIINDKFGELAESQDFINKIADNRNVLEKFIDSIKNMIKYVKGTDEERQLMKLQKNLEKEFAKRYKETDFSKGEGDTAYSLGKHYGDLGKGNDTYYGHMYDSRRSTGHFGTGTYFVGEDYQPGENSSYANRPVQKVEFDDYDNLFKPANRDAGFDLHDALKEVNYNNTPISKELYDKLLPYYEASFKSYNDVLDEDYDNDYKNVRNMLEEAGVETEEPQSYYDSGKGQFGNTYERYLEDKITDVLNNYDRYQKAERDLKRVLGITDEQFNKAIEKVRATEKEYESHSYDQKLKDDSLSTVFMKTLGYNGVDVRGIEGLDDTTYGSVIYDLDNKTNNVRYSLTSNKDSQGRDLTPQQQEYFKNTKIVDDKGNLLAVYRGEPTIGKTTYESKKGGGNKENNEYGIYFTNSKDFAKDFAFERIPTDDIFFVKKGKEGELKEAYLNITNPLDLENITEEQIRNLYPYASSMAKQITNEEKFVSDMLNWQQIGNHQLMKSYLDMKEIADNTDYDGLIAKLNVQGDEIEYAVFNSNQIKSTDNLNPTENDDIRLSLTSNENIDSKEIAPIGTTTEETIAPIREDLSNITEQMNNLSNQIQTLQNELETSPREPITEDIAPVNRYKALTEEEATTANEEMFKDENYWKQIDELSQENKLDNKLAKKLAKNMSKEFGLRQKQIKDMQDIIEKSWDNGYTLQEIRDEIENQFGYQKVLQKNQDAIEAQNLIRQFPIKVSPEIQKDIADYGYWKQGYFGKIKFSNAGESVSNVYGQLSELNPGMFPADIINDTDQLLRIAEVADMDKKYSIDYQIPSEVIDEVSNYIYDTFNETLYADAMKQQTDLENQAMQYNENLKEIPVKKKTRAEVREFLQNGMGITTDDLQVGNDIKALSYQMTTPERVNEKVFGREVGRKINEQTVNFAKHQEAERIRFLNKERNEIKDLGIKARSEESALVQKYGEGLMDDVQLAEAVEDVKTQEKIKNAARVLRSKYDTYLDMINEELVDMGYDPIPKRKDYMRHFQELTDKFSMAGIPFNRQDLNADNLPTDINGLTEFNVPGKNWFASAQRRTGDKTTYDAITGIDGYLEGASNLMYHTETIQRYRALEKLIRDTYGQQHGLDVFGDDLSSEQAMQRIQDIQEGKLSNYVAWLKEQGNAIAGKKTALDRAPERIFGRKGYSFFNTLKKSTGSNMTGLNVRSALTNFISSTIAAAKTSKMAMVHGTVDTIRNMFHDDGFINHSDFLTSRLRSDTSLSKKAWQKVSNAGQIFMSGSDWFTSNLIVRSKYYEGLSKGMTDAQAIKYADDFGARVMGDRSKGATAEAFNSKTLGFLTQFQLETNNQWQYMIHDTKMDFQENLAKEGGLKAGATMVFQMGQLAAYSYLFNEMFEKLTGSRAAFDPVDIFKKLFAPDKEDEDKDFETRMKEAGKELADALPFTSLFGSGGRLPIGEMLTPAQTLYDYITGGTNEYGQEITLNDVKDETLSSLPYYLLPTGYGQVKKTIGGLSMYDESLPTPGSYTDSGNLRFTADTDTGSVIKNALFGKWSGEEAQKYIDSGYKTIKAKDIPLMKELDMNSSQFREFQNNMKEATETTKDVDGTTYTKYFDDDGDIYWYDKSTKTVYDEDMNETDIDVMDLTKAKANELKFDYVSNLNIDEDAKQTIFEELFTNTTEDKYGYKKYTDDNGKTYWYDEDTDTLYNNKYNKVDKDEVEGLTEVSDSKDFSNYKDYGSYAEFDYAFKNPEKYKTMKAIAGYENYQKYQKELTAIRDNTKEDKKETIAYINSLDLTIPQKAMFIKQYYPSFNQYNKEIVNYIANSDMSYEDKIEILNQLKFKIDDNGRISWK